MWRGLRGSLCPARQRRASACFFALYLQRVHATNVPVVCERGTNYRRTVVRQSPRGIANGGRPQIHGTKGPPTQAHKLAGTVPNQRASLHSSKVAVLPVSPDECGWVEEVSGETEESATAVRGRVRRCAREPVDSNQQKIVRVFKIFGFLFYSICFEKQIRILSATRWEKRTKKSHTLAHANDLKDSGQHTPTQQEPLPHPATRRATFHWLAARRGRLIKEAVSELTAV